MPLLYALTVKRVRRLDVTTNQPAVQMFTCDGIPDGFLPRKKDQGGPSTFYEANSCVAIEQEGWLDAINNPQWHVNQVYGPERDFWWTAKYQFSVMS